MLCIFFLYPFKLLISSTYVPAREMGPRELLKSYSPSFGRADDWAVNWDSSHPPAYPSALGTRLNTGWWGTCEGTPTLKSVKRVISSQSDK